jgi:hypothetical protein
MTPPFLAHALIAAGTTSEDYDSVAGDLAEEYAGRATSAGRANANRWYWSQAVRSIPSLLSYSRGSRSARAKLATTGIVVLALVAMLFVKDMIDRLIDVAVPGSAALPAPLYFALDWLDAALFGGILSACVRGGGVRLALVASVALVAAFALPVVLGFAAPLGVPASVLLLGTIPAMAAGAAAFQVLRRRNTSAK